MERDACYYAKVVGGSYPAECSWDITDENEFSVASESALDSSPPFCIGNALIDCDAGSGYDIDAGACSPCPKGSYESSDNCYLCPSSTYSDAIGSVECTACPENTGSDPGSTRSNQCFPVTCFDVILYDSYGDGWDTSKLDLFDEDHTGIGEKYASFTLEIGSEAQFSWIHNKERKNTRRIEKAS